jgi:hypothetical protein
VGCKPSVHAYPQPLTAEKKGAVSKVPTAVLSTTTRAKERARKKEAAKTAGGATTAAAAAAGGDKMDVDAAVAATVAAAGDATAVEGATGAGESCGCLLTTFVYNKCLRSPFGVQARGKTAHIDRSQLSTVLSW